MADAAQNDRGSDVYGLASEPKKNDLARLHALCVHLRIRVLFWSLRRACSVTAPVTSRVFEARYPSERPCPSEPVLDRTVASNPTERVVEHEEEKFRLGFSRCGSEQSETVLLAR